MSAEFYRAVIIAMIIMWVMQSSVHEVVDVIAVRHGFVSAARPMHMGAPGLGRAAQGIGIADLDNVFVDMIPMHVMQMTIVEVIDMAMMAHSRVSTTRTMLMRVIRMMLLGADGHEFGLAGAFVRFFPTPSRLGSSARIMTFQKHIVPLYTGMSSVWWINCIVERVA